MLRLAEDGDRPRSLRLWVDLKGAVERGREVLEGLELRRHRDRCRRRTIVVLSKSSKETTKLPVESPGPKPETHTNYESIAPVGSRADSSAPSQLRNLRKG